MLDFLDSIHSYIVLTIVLCVLAFFISAFFYFGIKGVEIGNFEPKEKSVENFLKFLKKKFIRIIVVVFVACVLTIGIISNSFYKGTINEIQKMYKTDDYFISEIEKSDFENLNLDFLTFSKTGASSVRGSWIDKNDSILFTIGNSEKQFRLKLKSSVSDSLLYYVYIENYRYTSYEPYAKIRKSK